MAKRRSGRTLVIVGALVLVVTVITTAALLYVAQRRYDDAVRGLARAPVGCDTTLRFTDAGTFTLFVETEGSLDDVSGGCDAPGTYRRESDRPPRVQVQVFDPGGVERPLERTVSPPYSISGFVASAYRTVDIARTGDHVIRVASDADDIVISVGRHPDDAAYPAEQGAIAVAILGGLGGAALLVWGALRRRTDTDSEDDHGDPVLVAPELPRQPPLGPPPMPPPPGVPVSPPGWSRPTSLPPPTGPPMR
jgi:hypothetical protein